MAELSAFASAQDRTAAQKKALLDAVAQAGTAGATAYQQAKTQTEGIRQGAVGQALNLAKTSPVGTIPGGTAGMTAPLEQNIAMRQADLAQGEAAFGQDIARQQAAGSQYFDQLSGAIPIVEQRTKQAVERILSEERDRQAERQMQMQMQQESLAAARESRASSASGNSLRDQIAQNEENRRAYCFDNPDDPKCLDSSERKLIAADAQSAGNTARGNFVNQALISVRDREGDKVGQLISDAFRQTDVTPLAYIDSLLAKGGILETRGMADRGGTGKSHKVGLLNYEYIRDRVAEIMAQADAAASSSTRPASSSGGGVDG